MKSLLRRLAPAPLLDRWRLWKRARIEERAEVLVVSFHGSGRTWLRVLIGRAVEIHFGLGEGRALELDRLGRVPGAPRIALSHDDWPQWKLASELETDKSRYRDKKIVLLTRDPRDVVVSSYHHKTRRLRAWSGSLDEYLDEPRGSFDALLAWYRMWWKARDVPREFLLVRYEDLHRDAAGELDRVLRLSGLECSEETLEAAVEYAGIDRLREFERTDRFGSDALREVDPTDPRSAKVRRGVVGSHRDELSAEQIARLTARLSELPKAFGYR